MVLGAYRLLRLLGEGGMGQVFLAEHARLERQVALKLLRPSLARDRDFVRRFFQEARAVTRIRHPNIVEITDFVEDAKGRSYFIMELLSGQTLSKLLADQGAMPLGEVLEIARQICDALWAVHQEGFIHRDLKPENVFLNQQAPGEVQVKLLDFGLVKGGATSGDPSLVTSPELVVGTPGYMSPEQIRGAGELDRRSDIYALGVILYEMVTGVRPLVGTTVGDQLVKTVTMLPTAPRELLPEGDLPQPVEDLIMRCMAKEPDQRPQSVREIMVDLEQITSDHVQPDPQTPGEALAASVGVGPERRRRSRLWLLFSLGGLLVVVLGLVAALLLWGREQPAPTPAVRRAAGERAGVIARLAQVWQKVQHRERGKTSWRPAERGLGLVHHDWLRTGVGARALVRFNAGGHLEIQEQAEVVIEAPRRDRGGGPPVSAVAHVKRGTVMALVRPGAPVRVTTPDGKTALVTNRGKETASVRLRARDDGRLEMAVLKGQARVRAGSRQLDLGTRQVVELERGELGQAGKLLPFPESLEPGVDAWLTGKTRLALRWTAVKGARSYRVQLSHFMGFDDKLVDEVVKSSSIHLSRLVPETYFWRVATINAGGNEGEFGFARRFRIITRAPAEGEALLMPEEGAVVEYIHRPRPVTFRWSGAGRRFKLRISRRPALDRQLVVKKTLRHTSIRIATLRPGVYYWGVDAVDDEGRSHPLFDKAHRLVIVKRTRPRVHLPAIEWR
jgi:hypothetical protein